MLQAAAAGFFFAKELAEKFRDVEDDVTIGIIGCNWGGTSASAWMSREAQMKAYHLIAEKDAFGPVFKDFICGQTMEK